VDLDLLESERGAYMWILMLEQLQHRLIDKPHTTLKIVRDRFDQLL
jgi:hypothetical protein